MYEFPFVQNFPSVPDMISKIQSEPILSLGYSSNAVFENMKFVCKSIEIYIFFLIKHENIIINIKYNRRILTTISLLVRYIQLSHASLCRQIFDHCHLQS